MIVKEERLWDMGQGDGSLSQLLGQETARRPGANRYNQDKPFPYPYQCVLPAAERIVAYLLQMFSGVPQKISFNLAAFVLSFNEQLLRALWLHW